MAHLAHSGSFKYFWKSLRECKVAVFHRHPKSSLQALDCHCQGNGNFLQRILRLSLGAQGACAQLSLSMLAETWLLPFP